MTKNMKWEIKYRGGYEMYNHPKNEFHYNMLITIR